eukprot:6208018-Pleurochrysis_carterae.AAC.3
MMLANGRRENCHCERRPPRSRPQHQPLPTSLIKQSLKKAASDFNVAPANCRAPGHCRDFAAIPSGRYGEQQDVKSMGKAAGGLPSLRGVRGRRRCAGRGGGGGGGGGVAARNCRCCALHLAVATLATLPRSMMLMSRARRYEP